MKNIIKVALLFLAIIHSLHAYKVGSLSLDSDHEVHYRYQEAKVGKPTILLLNGLIYSLDNWTNYLNELDAKGIGYVLVAFSAQPESLKLLNTTPYFSQIELSPYGPKQKGLETQTLVDEVMAVMESLGIKRFNLMTLSYGSTVGSLLATQYKDRIDSLIFMAPAVLPSNRYQAIGESRYQYYLSLKGSSTSFGASDYYYDLEFYSTLASVISPLQHSFDGVRFLDFFHGVYQLVRSVKWFDLKEYANADLPPTYLLLAENEEAPLLADQYRFWNGLQSNPATKSLVFFKDAYHAVVGSNPKLAAKLTEQIILGQLAPGEHQIETKK